VPRIASVPSDHPYVRHLEAPSGPRRAVRLPDPPVPGAVPGAGQWWPSPVLEPSWIREHADRFDVVHLHFGFEHRTPEQLGQWVATLRALGRPLVLTVHDLTNPHLKDQAPHLAALDVLVPAAAQVLTLTDGAAAEISQRWGRPVTVLPHPHVVDLERMAQPRPPSDGFVFGLHAKPRAGNDPEAVRAPLARAVAGLPGARLHPGPRPGRLSDDELWDHLSGLDALVLAYRSGTHSGFVEACHDLGTTVLAPRTGHLAQQAPVLSYDLDVPGSLEAAAARAVAQGPGPKADPVARAAQRTELADAHARVYAGALAASDEIAA
jgi:hypothetical protein